MDIATVLAKYDLSLSDVVSADGLVSLRKAFSDLLDTLSADTETQQNREKEIRDSLKNEWAHLSTSQFNTELRTTISTIVERDEDVLVAMVDLMQEIKQDLMILRDFHVSAIARENKPEKVKDSTEVETRKQEAQTLREAIVSVFSLMGRPTDVDGFPTKQNKEGLTMPDLPRVPIGTATGSVRGRGAKVRQLLFEVDDKKIPAGVLFYDVVKDLCDLSTGFVIKPSEVKDLVDESGQEFAPEGYKNRWTVFGPAVGNHKVSGWLPEDK